MNSESKISSELDTSFIGSSVLLDASVVRAGDVLLSGSGSIKSLTIAVATGGEFSHAALWLPLKPKNESMRSAVKILQQHFQPLMLVEADSTGVGFTPLAPTGLIDAEGNKTAMAYVLDSSSHYKLLRHPAIANIGKTVLDRASSDLEKHHLVRPYSELSRLVDPLNLRPALKLGLQTAIDFFSKIEPDSGAFCSELVAIFYAELGLPLFDRDREPISIAPNHLDSENCLLVEVPDAFLQPEQLKGWTLNRQIAPIIDRQTYLEVVLEKKRHAKALNDLADASEQQVRKMMAPILAALDLQDISCAIEATAAHFSAAPEQVSAEEIQHELIVKLIQRYKIKTAQ